MANTKQAKKRIVQNQKRSLRNKAIVSRHRTELKKVLQLLSDKEAVQSEEFKKQFALVNKLSDSAVSKGVYHRNKAARIKSRLHARLNKHNVSSDPVAHAKSEEEVPEEPVTNTEI